MGIPVLYTNKHRGKVMNPFGFKLMTLALMLFAFQNAKGYDLEIDGLYYDIVSIADKTCALTSGDKNYSGIINIPDSVSINGRFMKVVAIKDGAFIESEHLDELTIPASVVNIFGKVFKYGSTIDVLKFLYGDSALTVGTYKDGPYSSSPTVTSFKYCNPKQIFIDRELSSGFASHESVEMLTIGNHIEHFNAGYFNECSNLKKLIIEDSEAPLIFDYNWGQSQFKTCPLTDVYIGRNFQFYHDSRNDISPFEAKPIERLVLGNEVTILEKESFSRCSNLTTVIFPNIKEIGDYAFYECKNLNTPIFPSSITKIGYESFYSCNNLNEIILDCDVELIEYGAFGNCSSLSSVKLNGIIKKIGGSAFGYCEKLSTVDFGNFVETIGERALANSAITSITLPNSLKNIDKDAFYNCVQLKKVLIGSGIEAIGIGAFNSGYSGTIVLDSLMISSLLPPSISETSFSPKTYLNCTLTVPTESVQKYKDADYWKDFWNIEGAECSTSIELIPDSALKYPVGIYDIIGNLTKEPAKGLNIIIYSDGTVEKKYY